MAERTIDEYVVAYLEDRLDAAELRRLHEVLAGDPAARRRFVLMMTQTGAMRDALKPAAGEAGTRDSQVATDERLVERPVFAFPRWSWAAAAALFVVASLGAYLTLFTGGGDREDAAEGPMVAVVLDAADVEWDSEPLDPGASVGSQDIAIGSGEVELEMRGGANLTLSGPARMTLTGVGRVSLMRGSLSAASAAGLTVDLPGGAKIVDVSTRFEVTVDDAGDATLQVTQGAVDVYLPGVEPTRIVAGLPLRIVGGRAIARSERQDIAVANASFEGPGLGGELWSHNIDAWTVIGAASQVGLSAFGPQFAEPTPDGSQMAFVNEGGIEQAVDARLAGNVRYTLSVVVGNRPGVNSPDYTIELHAGDELLASATNPAMPDKGRFARATLAFDAPAGHAALGKPLRIVLRSNGSLGTKTQNHFDDVRLRAEPITIETIQPPQTVQPAGENEPQGDRS